MEVRILLMWAVNSLKPPSKQNMVEDIYNRYKWLMFATAARYTENPADQEDIVQTVLERLVNIFSAPCKAERSISAGYIVYMIRSASIDLLRKRGREAEHSIYVEDDQLAEMVKTEGTLDELLFPSEKAEQLWAIWPRLSAEDRFLLEGKYIFERTDKELAGILNCKPDSVRMKLTRARRRALKLLSERSSDE